jgi:hypothetical protein
MKVTVKPCCKAALEEIEKGAIALHSDKAKVPTRMKGNEALEWGPKKCGHCGAEHEWTFQEPDKKAVEEDSG